MKRYVIEFVHIPYGTHTMLAHTIKRTGSIANAVLECRRLAMRNRRLDHHYLNPARDGYSVHDTKKGTEVYFHNGVTYDCDY